MASSKDSPTDLSFAPDAGGKLIVAMGLPGSGKSSVFRCLAGMTNAESFHEPEEKDWPAAVCNRDVCGYFTAITWFRSMRVPALYQADMLRQQGRTVFVDSYYDKLLLYWLGKPGMEWLVKPDDAYYSLIESMAKKDLETLPDADCVVLFEVDNEVWQSMLRARSRRLNGHPNFLNSFETQRYFADAAKSYAATSGAILVDFHQSMNGVEHAAHSLRTQLTNRGVL